MTQFHHPCVSHDTIHMSCVTCQVSGVVCQVSHVTSNSQTVRARELKFEEKFYLLNSVTCHGAKVPKVPGSSCLVVSFVHNWGEGKGLT